MQTTVLHNTIKYAKKGSFANKRWQNLTMGVLDYDLSVMDRFSLTKLRFRENRIWYPTIY